MDDPRVTYDNGQWQRYAVIPHRLSRAVNIIPRCSCYFVWYSRTLLLRDAVLHAVNEETIYSVCRCRSLEGALKDIPFVVWPSKRGNRLAGLTANGNIYKQSRLSQDSGDLSYIHFKHQS